MKVFPLAFSLLSFWEALVYLEAALLARPQTVPLAKPVTELLATFDATLAAHMAARRQILQAHARCMVADQGLDGAIRQLHSDALHLAGQDRKKPEFTTLFNEHIAAVVRFGLATQANVAQKLVDKLGLDLYPQTLRDGIGRTLTGLIEAGRAELRKREETEVAVTGQRLKTMDWKEDANAVRLSLHGELTKLAAASGLGKVWVDAFFGSPEETSAPKPAAAEPEAEPK